MVTGEFTRAPSSSAAAGIPVGTAANISGAIEDGVIDHEFRTRGDVAAEIQAFAQTGAVEAGAGKPRLGMRWPVRHVQFGIFHFRQVHPLPTPRPRVILASAFARSDVISRVA